MLRTWLQRWLGVEQAAAPPASAFSPLERRVCELEEHVDFLHGALKKLRGRVTGGLRSEHPDPDGNGGGPVSDAPVVEHTSAFDRQAFYAKLDRDREYGRQVKGP